MSAETIGLLAYGLRPAPFGMSAGLLAAGAYTSASGDLQMERAHAGCHISSFCRNPLHPGPCKGWKHHLGLVSPGALHALEKVRHEKLEEKRKSKVAALLAEGKKVPKHLQAPIVYDPAKNKHINNVEHGTVTPGLGVPTKGLTPETAKATLDAIPTKAQVGAKLDAKHAAEAAAALKPHQAPQYLTLSKAGLKPGDKVFLHGKGKTAGPGQLVTVRKIPGNGKAQGYQFEGADGKMLPHAGGPAAKWHLSPAPGESFPDSPAQKVAANIATAKEKGHIPDVPGAKHEAQAVAVGKFLNSVIGHTPTDQSHAAFVKEATDKAENGGQLVPDAKVEAGAKKIAAKLYGKIGVSDHMHQGDLEQALIKDIHEGVNEGKPTPVLDAAKDAGLTLGQEKPGAVEALAKAVHEKLGTSGHDDTPAKPAKGLTSTSVADAEAAGKVQADAFHEPIGVPHAGVPSKSAGGTPHDSPNADAAPHVKQAIAYANGHQTATDTKKLAAYHKLTAAETAALDPNTKKLMEANLNSMHKKFLDPKKKAHVLDVLNKVQVAQGSGAGAGAGSVRTPTTDALHADADAKGAKGAMAAFMHGVISAGPGTQSHTDVAEMFAGMHKSPDQANADNVFQTMAEGNAKKKLASVGLSHETGVGKAALPHLAAELKNDLKGGDGQPTPLLDAIGETHETGSLQPFVDAVSAHPQLGPDALGVKAAHAPAPSAESAHALSLHAANVASKPMIPGFEKTHNDVLSAVGQETHHSGLAESFATTKTMKTLASLDLGADTGSKVQAQLHTVLHPALTKDYKQALDEGATEPSGIAGKIDDIVKSVNTVGDDLAKHNGWPKDSQAVKDYKAALFTSQVHAALGENPGAGGSSTHSSPAASVSAPPAAPNVTPAVPYSAPTHTPSATTKTEKGAILLKHAQALKVVKIMKSFPEGQYLESPEPKIWDNLVAISAHEGITPMQALTTLDDQNAKKLGVTNTNLLEKKIRAWLATGDGKAYADANHTPKPALLSHVQKVGAGHTDFTNKTGIDLLPGEKVQKLGGPGEFVDNEPDSKFGKHDVATAEADQIKFKKENGIKFSPQQKAALTEYVDGSSAINGWLRDEHTPWQKSIDNAIYLQSMMMPTQRDHLLLRGTGWTQFPPEARSYEGLQKLVGETLEEPAFLSASVSKSSSGFGGAVKMHIQAPKGTMGVFTKDDQYKSQYLGSEAELLLAARTELKVLKVWKEGGQVQVLMRVVS